jgi:glycosyltransferase involved in cell wall biosynthesis
MPAKVSVIIPTYNNAALLHETLDGVRRQTFKDLEIIVVDDGSTDDTAGVVRRYAPNIYYVHQSNQGPAAARNKGAAVAQEFIAFCDHDDIGTNDTWRRCSAVLPTTLRRVFDRSISERNDWKNPMSARVCALDGRQKGSD